MRAPLLVAGPLLALVMACRPAAPPKPLPQPPPPGHPSPDAVDAQDGHCGGEPMTVKFYDAGQALAALVTLPGGKRILVDAGENPKRPACGAVCAEWHDRVIAGLKADIGEGGTIDLLWITHQHSDHLGGVPGVIDHFDVQRYVDNGRDLEASTVKAARDAVATENAKVTVVDETHRKVPIQPGNGIKLTGLAPKKWPAPCTRSSSPDANDCSIALRIDYCKSSVLFTGDASAHEEELFASKEVTLLQVGHHGSNTSSGEDFIASIKPKYAVVSSAKKGEGTNKTYCHPLKSTVDRLTTAMGGAGSEKVLAYDDSTRKCRQATPADWKKVPASDRIWFTARDGDVTLVTTGDGTFAPP